MKPYLLRPIGFTSLALAGAFHLAGCGDTGAVTASNHSQNLLATQAKSRAAPVEAVAPVRSGPAPVEAVAPEDRSGPSRRARCRIGDAPMRPCVFTPLFGDGRSFNIELDDRELRVVADGEVGQVFEVFGPARRVRKEWSYHRDRSDPACWVADLPTREPSRVCAD